MIKKTEQYKVAKKLVEKGFGVIPLTPAGTIKKNGKNKRLGKIPSIRASKFENLDKFGNPIPKKDLNKYGKEDYEVENGGAKNPITKIQGLIKPFCETNYTSRSIKGLNIGIITGSETGVVALDIDGNEGVENLKILQKHYNQNKKLPKTLSATSGRDSGYHVYFRLPKKDGKYIKIPQNTNKLAPNVDFKGENGITVAPPSIHWSGVRYKWITNIDNYNVEKLPILPKWIQNLLLLEEYWMERTDGLFEEERKNLEKKIKKHQKKTKAYVSEEKFSKLEEIQVFSYGFYIKWDYSFFHLPENESGTTIYCNCPVHNSTSKESLHIDFKNDHYIWYCFGCSCGGRAYTPEEYKQLIGKQNSWTKIKKARKMMDYSLLDEDDKNILKDFLISKNIKKTPQDFVERKGEQVITYKGGF